MKNLTKYLAGAACILALAFSTGALIKVNAAKAAPVAGQPVDLTYAAEKALPAVVHIKYVQNSKMKTVEVQSDPFGGFFSDPFGFFGNPGGGGTYKKQVPTPKKEATGSGVIISSDGYIVTNNHVVAGADQLTVTLNDNSEYSAKIIGTDETTDLALIKVNAKDLPTLPIGDSDALKVGEWVLAVGNPFNLNSTVTAGIVSAKARSLGANGVESFIQTDAAINAGNSGGALVNTKGELVGINAMLYSQTGSYSGYGFAIPTTIMNKVVDDLKKYGTVQRALLGITGMDVHKYIDSEKEKGNDTDFGTNDGIYVSTVSDNGAGASAGLQEGDVIVNIDNKKVTKMSELQEYLNGKRPGEKVSITYLRDKKKITKTVTLKNEQGNTELAIIIEGKEYDHNEHRAALAKELPAYEQGNTEVVKPADIDILGANFKEITSKQKEELGINYGVEVIKVNKGALANEGINKGFIIQNINNEPVKTLEQLQDIVKKVSMSKEPVLFIQGLYPSGKKAYYAVVLSD